jgi:hypothetical protein
MRMPQTTAAKPVSAPTVIPAAMLTIPPDLRLELGLDEASNVKVAEVWMVDVTPGDMERLGSLEYVKMADIVPLLVGLARPKYAEVSQR